MQALKGPSGSTLLVKFVKMLKVPFRQLSFDKPDFFPLVLPYISVHPPLISSLVYPESMRKIYLNPCLARFRKSRLRIQKQCPQGGPGLARISGVNHENFSLGLACKVAKEFWIAFVRPAVSRGPSKAEGASPVLGSFEIFRHNYALQEKDKRPQEPSRNAWESASVSPQRLPAYPPPAWKRPVAQVLCKEPFVELPHSMYSFLQAAEDLDVILLLFLS